MAGEASAITKRARDIVAPLGDEEEQRAVETALAHFSADRAALRVYGAELAIEKRRGKVPERRVRVLVALRGSSLVHEVLIDASGDIAAVEERPSLNLPYLADEVEEATAIAARDERVADLLGDRVVGVGTFAPKNDERSHRLVGLHYLDTEDPHAPRPLATVVVDLAADEALSVRDDSAGSARDGS